MHHLTWLFLVIIFLFILQERDLEMELGDDYVLDLQSKKRFHLIYQAAFVNLWKVDANVIHVCLFL